ncbi:WD domain-containing protein, G-beta repeat-containing protein, partial [Nitrosospira briensis]
MSLIFLSHSSIDELEAVALKHWLLDNGWEDVFLDLDPEHGLRAGERWQEALRRAADRCEAVVFIISPAWAKSKWCLTEFLLAKSLSKLIFGVVVKETALTELPTELTAEYQLTYLIGKGSVEALHFVHHEQAADVSFLANGLARLRLGLQTAGLSASYFPWPPQDDKSRAPYRGLEPLDAKDAAVFFGRDTEILQGLDKLRGMRAAGNELLFVILGPSGSGKSSFLRAGLLPRLARNARHFHTLNVIRPERSPLYGQRGVANAIYCANEDLGLMPVNLGEVKTMLENGGAECLGKMLHNIQNAARHRLLGLPEDAPPPTLVLPVDQAEELFSSDATEEAHSFLELIGNVLRTSLSDSEGTRLSLIVAFTIRSDRYDPLQTAQELMGLKTVVFDALKPMPRVQFKEIIKGPAIRASLGGKKLEVMADLVDQLLLDCEQGADTLPLLSLTLSRIYRDYSSGGDLRLDQYKSMGGMAKVIKTEVESILSSDPGLRKAQLDTLHAAFIPWLATVNPENNQPVRRRARMTDLPPASHVLICALIEKRLLLWDAASGKELHVLRGHEGSIVDSQFSPDGKTVVTASADETARLWDAASGRELQVLRGHEKEVIGAQFSPDGKTVLTASWDETARLWDAASGRELQVLRGHEKEVIGAQFSPDGKTVLTASWDETARLW